MLQQTQVATVTAYFLRFMEAFPTLAALAAASEHDVLRLWQGLGYYSRARNLHATARKIAADFDGQIPSRLDELTALPGIGRYTAGAIASIAFDRQAPILDGNVARVLCRLEKIESDPRNPKTVKQLWALAEKILPTRRCGQFNSALMELGATVCTPRLPKCPICPVKRFCRAAAAGLQDVIPPPRKSRPTPVVNRWTICVHRNNRWLLERRPSTGRWGGLWQFPTIEPDAPAAISERIGLPIGDLREIGQIHHALTHRRYVFTAFVATARTMPQFSNRKWIRLEELHEFPRSRPQLKIAQMIRASPPPE
jgi:A/G-specific adenine glycosylase